jgi:hypothetical protein
MSVLSGIRDMRGISDIRDMSGWGDMSDMSLIYGKL